MDDEKKGRMGTYAIWAFIVGVAIYIVYAYVLNPAPDPKMEQLKDPEKALQLYMKTAWDFEHNPSAIFEDVKMCVPDSDWNWWHDNYQELAGDLKEFQKAMDPGTGDMLAKRLTLGHVMSLGADTGEITTRNVGDSESTFIVREKDGTARTQTDIKVKVVKIGKYWKVSGFAGGMAAIKHQEAPGDFVTSELEKKKPAEKEAAAAAAPAKKPAPNAPPPKVEASAAPAPAHAPDAAPAPPAKPGPKNRRGPKAAAEPAAPPVNPLTAPADILIDQARQDWEAQNFKASIGNAERALAIYKRVLGEADPKIAAVQTMIEAAQAQQKAKENAPATAEKVEASAEKPSAAKPTSK